MPTEEASRELCGTPGERDPCAAVSVVVNDERVIHFLRPHDESRRAIRSKANDGSQNVVVLHVHRGVVCKLCHRARRSQGRLPNFRGGFELSWWFVPTGASEKMPVETILRTPDRFDGETRDDS